MTQQDLRSAIVHARLEGNLDEALIRGTELETKLLEKEKVASVAELAKKILAEDQTKKETADRKLELAWVCDAIGNVKKMLRKDDASPSAKENGTKSYLDMALQLRQSCLEQDPTNEKLKTTVAQSLSSLAMYYHSRNLEAEADQAHLEALQMFSQVPLQAKASFAVLPIPATNSSTGEADSGKSEEEEPFSAEGQMGNLQDGSSSLLVAASSELEVEHPEDDPDDLMDWRRFMEMRLEKVQSTLKGRLDSGSMDEAARGITIDESNKATAGRDKDGFDSMGDTSFKQADIQQLVHMNDFKARLVLLNVANLDPIAKQLETLLPVSAQCDHVGNEATKNLEWARELDSVVEHIPNTILLNPLEHDVVHIGRQTYEETVGFYQSRVTGSRPSQRKIGYVRLDSTYTDRQISRRHAQIKFSKIHPVVQPMLNHDTDSDEGDVESQSEASEQILNARRKSGQNSLPRSDFDSPGSIFNLDPLAEHAWVIRDLGSTNGILVNGLRIQEFPLRDGDIISFGGANHVPSGASVLTHKRRPADSVFVYRFETTMAPFHHMISKDSFLPSISSRGFRIHSLDHVPSMQSPLSRFVQAFQLFNKPTEVSGTTPSPDVADQETLHFYLTYMSVLAVLHPDKVSRLSDHAGASQHELLDTVKSSLELYERAKDSGIPFQQWSNWLRANLN